MEKDLKEIQSMKLEKKIYRLRHRDGLKWGDIVTKVKEEFDRTLSISGVEDVYNRHISRSNVIIHTNNNRKQEAGQVNDAWIKEVKQIIKVIKKGALKHYDIASKKLLEHAENKDGDKKYFDYLPVMVGMQKSLLDQASFLSKRLEKIEIVQSKLVLNETQILQIVNEAYAQKEKETGHFIHPGRQRLEPIGDR